MEKVVNEMTKQGRRVCAGTRKRCQPFHRITESQSLQTNPSHHIRLAETPCLHLKSEAASVPGESLRPEGQSPKRHSGKTPFTGGGKRRETKLTIIALFYEEKFTTSTLRRILHFKFGERNVMGKKGKRKFMPTWHIINWNLITASDFCPFLMERDEIYSHLVTVLISRL